jgi:hypothetical protein
MRIVRWGGFCAAAALAAQAPAQTLYKYDQGRLFDGRYGPVARVQESALDKLRNCGSRTRVTVDGFFGPGFRANLAELAKCPDFASRLSADTDAQRGDLTLAYWNALMSEPPPTVDDRARTIMLTFEATDYTRMEWNFCQSRPLYAPVDGQPICYSNDPKSYLTWGPNGATGGGGREVQLILAGIDAIDPKIIDKGFAGEAAAVRRMFQMQDETPSRSLETYLCGIWSDSVRRAAWRGGFSTIGRDPRVQKTFDDFYMSASLDGGKIGIFMKAYASRGLVPTEIDYAFFKDRAAQTTPVLAAIEAAIAKTLTAHPGAARWQIRRSIALSVRPANQRVDRLGRDVAFYVDGIDTPLSDEEKAAWDKRGNIRATEAGLSDTREYRAFSPGQRLDTAIKVPATLSPQEAQACPAAVLNTQRPPR